MAETQGRDQTRDTGLKSINGDTSPIKVAVVCDVAMHSTKQNNVKVHILTNGKAVALDTNGAYARVHNTLTSGLSVDVAPNSMRQATACMAQTAFNTHSRIRCLSESRTCSHGLDS